jgi:hypothetical protein
MTDGADPETDLPPTAAQVATARRLRAAAHEGRMGTDLLVVRQIVALP